jgi:hypothetical protein
VTSLAGIVCDVNSIFMLVLHAFVNTRLVSNFKFTTIMDSTLSDIFKANHEQNIVEFETTRLVVARYALTQPERAED